MSRSHGKDSLPRWKIKWRLDGAERICELHQAARSKAPYAFAYELGRVPRGKLSDSIRREFWAGMHEKLGGIPGLSAEWITHLIEYISHVVAEPSIRVGVTARQAHKNLDLPRASEEGLRLYEEFVDWVPDDSAEE